jgi:hypothetical protein
VWVNDGVFVSEDHHTAKGLQFLCRHLVGLCVTYRHIAEEEARLPSRFTTCSGTLLFVEGALYFLTAGHVLRELKELRDSKHIIVEHASLADIFGARRVSDTPIPIDLHSALLCFVDDEGLGLDFGVIPIGPHHARLLTKNGVIALSEENWIKQQGMKFDGYLMLGFPAELVSERVSDSSRVIIQPTTFSVKRLDPAADNSNTTYPRFIGQVSHDLPLKSLKGMSGGLILGFRLQPKLSYWVVAIQSSWRPETKMFYGCSLPILASLMTHWARENIAVLQELDPNTTMICPTVPGAALPLGHPFSGTS